MHQDYEGNIWNSRTVPDLRRVTKRNWSWSWWRRRKSQKIHAEAKVWVWIQCCILGFRGPSADLPRTFRGPSVELPQTSCARRGFSDHLHELSQEDMLLKAI